MMFYSKKSKNKVIHHCHCYYFRHMDHNSIGKFETIEEARGAGYHLCKCCAPMGKYYRKEYYNMKGYVTKNALIVEYMDGEIVIQTPYSNWKIIVNGQKNHIFLYHKNTYMKRHDKRSLVPGYHSQSVRRNTLMDYLKYIVEHDAYRLHYPEHQKKGFIPLKGKKKNKQRLKKEKKRERYRGMMRVLALIENEANYRQMKVAK